MNSFMSPTFRGSSSRDPLDLKDFVATFVKAKVLALQARQGIEGFQASLDALEVRQNAQLTPAMATEIVRLTSLVDSARSEELDATRTRLTDAVRQSLRDSADAIKTLAGARDLEEKAVTNELRESRARVRMLIEEATRKEV
ncbi:MAG: hypothetical protein O2856_15070 [Planctomycetota bacterium]|nr:hypothetical protein [Planctomycetota bacterium]